MKSNISLHIDNFRVDIAEGVSITLNKQLKDIKEFSKRKTSFSKPIKILHTPNNAILFKRAFNINEQNGWDRNSRPLAKLEVNNNTILEGRIKLDSINKDSYSIILYHDNVNIDNLFLDKLIDKTVNYTNQYAKTITRQEIRNVMNAGVRKDGKGINYCYIDYVGFYVQQPLMLPALAVRELLEEVLKTVGKTISFDPTIEKYINTLYMPFNGEYTELCKPWKYAKYYPLDTDVDTPISGANINGFDSVTCKYDEVLNIHNQLPAGVGQTYFKIEDRGQYQLDLHIISPSTEKPKCVIWDGDTYTDIKLEGTAPNFTATFNIESYDNFIYMGYDEVTTIVTGEDNTYIEITKLDSYYSGNTVITANDVLPKNYKCKDLFNDVITLFNAYVETNDNNIHLKTYESYVLNPTKSIDWSDKINTDSIEISTLKSKFTERLSFKFGKPDDLYGSDYEQQYNLGILDKVDTNTSKNLAISSTVSNNENTPYIYSSLIGKGGKFTTKFKPRMLFVAESGRTTHFGLDSNEVVNHLPLLINRYAQDVNDPDNLLLGYEQTNTYEERNATQTGNNLYTRFYEQEALNNSKENLMFLEAEINLSASDYSTINFNDLIYISTSKFGSAYFQLNAIKSFSLDRNRLAKIELRQVNKEDLKGYVNKPSYSLNPIALLPENKAKQEEIQGVSGGGSVGGGLSVTEVQNLINDSIKIKLDKTATAVNSHKLEGHPASYFAKVTDLDNFAKLDIENTFQERQTFLNGIDVLGDFNIRNTVDLNVSDNLIEINKGETGSGVTVQWAGVSIDRGLLPSTAIVWDEVTKTFKYGVFNALNGQVLGNTSQGVVLGDGTDNASDFIGKKIKFFKASALAIVSTILTYNTNTHMATVSDDITGVGNGWKWRVLTDNDLHTIPTIEGTIAHGNGVIWNGDRFVDAGYKWALKNGDTNEDFNIHHLEATNAQLGGVSFLYSTIGTTSSQIHVNYDNADGSTDEYRNLYIFNGKHSAIANFFGETKKVDFYGDIQANTNIHSKDYVSGITGKGWNITQDADAEFTNLSIRDSLTVNTLVNNKINVQNGDLIVSDSAKVTFLDSVVEIYVEKDIFQVGDVVRCSKNVGETYYLTITNIKDSALHTDSQLITFTKVGTGTIAVDDLLVRWNSSIASRQGLLYLSGLNEYLDVVHHRDTKVRLGNLTGINDSTFGQLNGYGLYADNVYLKGKMQLAAGSSISFADVQGGQAKIDEVNGDINTLNNDVQNVNSKIDGLEVGERNLLLDSGRVITNNKYLTAQYNLSEAPKVGEEIRIVLKGKLGSDREKWVFYNSGAGVVLNGGDIKKISNNTEIYVSKPFKWTIGASSNTFLRVYAFPYTGTSNSTIEWIKLVRGNKTSLDWSAATEDAAIYSKVGGTTLITNNKIRTSLLEASEIRSNIINTTYLNGLSLNFTKGHIGGWDITSNYIKGGNTYISSSGNIFVPGKYSLDSDGAGYLASHNITWDKNGNTNFKGTINGSTINGTNINGGTIAGANITTNTAFASQRVEIDSVTNSLALYNFKGSRSVYISDSGLANYSKGVGLIDMNYFNPNAPGPSLSNVKHSSLGSYYNNCLGFHTTTKDNKKMNTSVLIDAQGHSDTSRLVSGLYVNTKTNWDNQGIWTYDIYAENTSFVRKLWTDELNGVEMRTGVFVSNTDGNQTIYFDKPFTGSVFLANVSLGGATGEEMIAKVTCYRDRIVVNRNNGVSGSPQGYYVAYGRPAV